MLRKLPNQKDYIIVKLLKKDFYWYPIPVFTVIYLEEDAVEERIVNPMLNLVKDELFEILHIAKILDYLTKLALELATHPVKESHLDSTKSWIIA